VNAKGVIIQPARTDAIFRKNWSLKNIAHMTENTHSIRRPK